MSNQHFYRSPFASSGDKTDIPETTQSDGTVSYPQGFGFDYERDPATDPDAKNIQRDDFNGVMFDVTENIQQYQLWGTPEWVTPDQNGGSAVAYGQYARVLYQGVAYESAVSNNTSTPGTDSNWLAVGGRLLSYKTFGASGTYTPTPGTKFIVVELIGAGGGAAGARATSPDYYAGGAGGGGGGYARSRFTMADVGGSKQVTIGKGGSAGINTTAATSGGVTAFGSLMSATGGSPGGGTMGNQYQVGMVLQQEGGEGGQGINGNLLNARGQKGGNLLLTRADNNIAGYGGGCRLGFGLGGASGSSGNGSQGPAGCGGSGGLSQSNGTGNFSGGAGGDGFAIIWEYA